MYVRVRQNSVRVIRVRVRVSRVRVFYTSGTLSLDQHMQNIRKSQQEMQNCFDDLLQKRSLNFEAVRRNGNRVDFENAST